MSRSPGRSSPASGCVESPRCSCLCESVKNITISLPDDVYRAARIKAAEMERSLSALVRELIVELCSRRDDFEERKQKQAKVMAQITNFRAADRLTRDDAHDRDALR